MPLNKKNNIYIYIYMHMRARVLCMCVCVCVCCGKVCKWLNKTRNLQFNKSYFFNLNEKFVEKQNLRSFFYKKTIY